MKKVRDPNDPTSEGDLVTLSLDMRGISTTMIPTAPIPIRTVAKRRDTNRSIVGINGMRSRGSERVGLLSVTSE